MELYTTIFNLFHSWGDIFGRECDDREYVFFHGPGQQTWGVEIRSTTQSVLFQRTWCIEKEETLEQVSQDINAAYLGYYS